MRSWKSWFSAPADLRSGPWARLHSQRCRGPRNMRARFRRFRELIWAANGREMSPRGRISVVASGGHSRAFMINSSPSLHIMYIEVQTPPVFETTLWTSLTREVTKRNATYAYQLRVPFRVAFRWLSLWTALALRTLKSRSSSGILPHHRSSAGSLENDWMLWALA